MKPILSALFLTLLLSAIANGAVPGEVPLTVTLSWTNNEKIQPVDGYFIERKLNALTFEPLTTVNGSANTSYVDTAVKRPTVPGAPSNIYTYRVAAVNTAGQSAFSNEASIEFIAPPIAPPVATGQITIVVRDEAGNVMQCVVDATSTIVCK